MKEKVSLRQERIDSDLYNANIKLQDENKLLKEKIEKAIRYMEERRDYVALKVIMNDLKEILGG